MRKFVAPMALTALVWGGGDLEVRAQRSMVDGGVERPAAVHEVQMVLNDAGEYRYVPDELTIKVGDTVRWMMVSGGPHNVQFKPDRIPDGAVEMLDAAMENKIGPINGQLLMAPGTAYEISFVGAPVGEYYYVCTPHELLQMVATLTVEE